MKPPYALLPAIDQARRMVALFDTCRESFNTQYTLLQLSAICDAASRSSWDFFPDEWTSRQIREALRGIAPDWKEDAKGAYVPVYTRQRLVTGSPRRKAKIRS